MDDSAFRNKTRQQLLDEIGTLRARITRLEEEHTRRIQLEEALHESDARFSTLLRTAPIGMGIVINRTLIFVNDYLCRMVGYSQNELLEKNTRILYPNEEEYQHIERAYVQITEQGRGVIESKFAKKDGSILHVMLNGMPIDQDDWSRGIIFTALDITPLKQSQKAVKEGENLLHSLMNGIDESILLLDKQGKVLIINDEGARRNGVSPEEMQGRDVFSFMPPKLARGRRAQFERILEEQKPLRFTDQRPGGQIYDNLVYPIFNSQNVLSQIAVIAQNITERSQMEMNMRNTKNILLALIEASPLPMFDMDLEGNVQTIWNTAAEETFGWQREEVLGRQTPLVSEENEEELDDLLDHIAAGNSITELEVQRMRKDGTPIDVSISAAPVRISSGEVTGVMVVLANVTERKRAENQLRKFKLGIERSGEVIFMTDSEGVIGYVNPTFTEVYGYDESEAIGSTPRILKSGKYGEEFYEQFWQAILSKQVVDGEIVNRTKHGDLVTVQGSASPILNEEGETIGFLAIHRDVTKQKQMEEQYRQSLKMQSIGRLAGGVAHDLNNLLTPIMGYAELLTTRINDDETLLGYAQQIHHATDRAKDLTQQLLAFGRKQTLKMETIDSVAAIAKFEKILRRTIREDIELRFHLKPESGHVRIDQSQIGQVIVNLAVNAQDAMPEGGRLTIGTDDIELTRKEAQRIPELEPGSYVMITISDTGEGIDSEILPQIFEPFFTTKVNGEGTGLGLATVYGIVKQHEGHISVYSEKSLGTTFRIYLPRVEPGTTQTTDESQLSRANAGEETIVIAEDDDMVRNYVYNLLMEKGYQVIEAANSREALDAVQKQSGQIDLLISDVIMPGMNGKELYNQIADRYPDIKVLYISGYTDDVISKHGILEQGVSFLQKPFSNHQLTEKIRDILDS